ncbi:MAG: hypothetical protein K8H84_06210 [Sulfuricella denitrificans]|nr:hypothetical protein [Sulfuricella denitrificans]
MSIIQRLEKLEAATQIKDQRWVRVIKDESESDDECIRRHGHNPDEQGVTFIIRCIVDAENGRIKL